MTIQVRDLLPVLALSPLLVIIWAYYYNTQIQYKRGMDKNEQLNDRIRSLSATLQNQELELTRLGVLREIRSKIHKEDGPAIYLRNNQVVYFLEGIQVPEHVVMNPESITIQEILQEQNVELRRILIERSGQGKFVTALGGWQESQDEKGILWSADRDNLNIQSIPERDRDKIFGKNKVIKFVQVKDSSTDREYFLQVPSSIKTPKDGIAWSFNLKEGDYNPVIET